MFFWGGNYGSDYQLAYLVTPYLASINNLSMAVVKNTDKTMKITYALAALIFFYISNEGVSLYQFMEKGGLYKSLRAWVH